MHYRPQHICDTQRHLSPASRHQSVCNKKTLGLQYEEHGPAEMSSEEAKKLIRELETAERTRIVQPGEEKETLKYLPVFKESCRRASDKGEWLQTESSQGWIKY